MFLVEKIIKVREKEVLWEQLFQVFPNWIAQYRHGEHFQRVPRRKINH